MVNVASDTDTVTDSDGISVFVVECAVGVDNVVSIIMLDVSDLRVYPAGRVDSVILGWSVVGTEDTNSVVEGKPPVLDMVGCTAVVGLVDNTV